MSYLGIILLDLLIIAVISLRQAIDIPTFHLDGAFQTASGLFRLADGQLPGRDFYPYLGIGVLFTLYPVFWLAGSNMAASLFAAQFVTLLGSLLSVSSLAALVRKRDRLKFAVVSGTIMLTAIALLWPELPPWLMERLAPGNSLRPLRSLIPYVVFGLAYIAIRFSANWLISQIGLGSLAGFALLWSNDFGLPTALLTLGLAGWHVQHAQSWKTSKLLVAPCIAAIVASCSIALSTGFSAAAMLRYNFLDVAGDQYWYFGPWIEDSRILGLEDIFSRLIPDFFANGWGLVWPALLAMAIFRPSLEIGAILAIGASLAGGGMLAVIGGHRGGYEAAYIFWCKTVLTLFGFAFLSTKLEAYWQRLPPLMPCLGKWLPALLLITVLGRNYLELTALRRDASSDDKRFLVSELGGYLPIAYRDYIAHIKSNRQKTVTEEYWGLWSATTRRFGAMPVDSVIHALGDVRTRARQNLSGSSAPQIIVTTTHEFSTDWQPWSMSANWWFYRLLFENYEPDFLSPSTIAWRRLATSNREADWQKCSIAQQPSPKLNLPVLQEGFYEVEIALPAPSNRRNIFLVRNNINDPGLSLGYLALSPYQDKHQFIAYLAPGQNASLDVTSLAPRRNPESIAIAACSFRPVNKSFDGINDWKPTFQPPHTLAPSNELLPINNQYLLNGLPRIEAPLPPLLIVTNNAANSERFKAKRHVLIANRDIGQITHLSSAGGFLLVFLNGSKIDPTKLGQDLSLSVWDK